MLDESMIDCCLKLCFGRRLIKSKKARLEGKRDNCLVREVCFLHMTAREETKGNCVESPQETRSLRNSPSPERNP